MSTQWEINLILNKSFTCIRLKLSSTINPHTCIKSKIGGKIHSQKTCQNKLLSPLFNSAKLSFSPGSFQLICGVKYLKKEDMTYQKA